MNQSFFLQLVERLEGFLGKLPASIQKPVLHELTPLKELFLKQRPPRFVLTGSHKLPLPEASAALFATAVPHGIDEVLMEVHRWHHLSVSGHGNISILDARGADATARRKVEEELLRQPADIFLHLVDGNSARPVLARDLETLSALLGAGGGAAAPTKVIGISLLAPAGSRVPHNGHGPGDRSAARARLQTALEELPAVRERLLQVFEVELGASPNDAAAPGAARLMALLAQVLPNEARVEMIRISRDRVAQAEIAQVLVKSTTAICAAIGAQPIPLADLPVLTALQLGMVTGIMYLSGRERSVRAATEFIAALGVNVGAGMVLREGARAMLKFFPGWGNVVCGMVAGAGTYALGRAAIVYFLEGVSLKDARRIYLRSRKKSPPRELVSPAAKNPRAQSGR